MITEAQRVPYEVHLWAVPKYSYEITPDNPDTHELRVYLGTDKPYRTGSVLISSSHDQFCHPGGFDTHSGEVDSYKQAIVEAKARALDEINALEARLQELLALEAQ